MLFNKNDIFTMVILQDTAETKALNDGEKSKLAQEVINKAYQFGLPLQYKLSKNAVLTVKSIKGIFSSVKPEVYASEELKSTLPLVRYKLEANGEIAGLASTKQLVFKIWAESFGNAIVAISIIQ